MEDRNFEEFDPEIDYEESMIKYEEVEGICKRHIEEGNGPYSEDEFTMLYKWMEESRFNEVILNMVLEGKLDVVIKDDELAFALTKSAQAEVEAMGIKPEPNPNSRSLLGNIKFSEDKDSD